MGHYIFVVAGSSIGNESGRTTLIRCAERGVWPLNTRTSHQCALTAGDKILFYVARKGDSERGYIIAKGQLRSGRIMSARVDEMPAWLGFRPTKQYDVPLVNVFFLEKPIHFRRLVSRLSFVKNKEKWGTSLQGGIRRIGSADYDEILRGPSGS